MPTNPLSQQTPGNIVGTPVARTGIVASDGAGINLTAAIPAAGVYRISWYLVVTTLFTTAGPTITFTWTDVSGTAQSVSSTAAVGVGSLAPLSSTLGSPMIVESNGSANITYKVTSTGTFGACAVYVVVEKIG